MPVELEQVGLVAAIVVAAVVRPVEQAGSRSCQERSPHGLE